MFARCSAKIETARTTVNAITSQGRPVMTQSTGIMAATNSEATDA
jgi:hypothetical protein